MRTNDKQEPLENAMDRLCRENGVYLVCNRERQIFELRPRFVPVQTPGYDVPKEAA